MYSSPPRRYSSDAIEENHPQGVTNSLKKSINKRKSIRKSAAYANSESSDEDAGERDSFRVQRVRAKELASDGGSAGGDGSMADYCHTPRSDNSNTRSFRVFPELPRSPLRLKKRVSMIRPTEGITGLCAPGSIPPKIVTIKDYSFSSPTVTVFAGQTVVFSLSRDIPTHVEHVLEGICEDNSELCFISPLLQCPEEMMFQFTPLYVGEIHVCCQVYPEMECEISVVSTASFRRVSSALSSMGPLMPGGGSGGCKAPSSPAAAMYLGSGLGLMRRSTDCCSETMTQSSFFDSDDEVSDHYSMHSTPRRLKQLARTQSGIHVKGMVVDSLECDKGEVALTQLGPWRTSASTITKDINAQTCMSPERPLLARDVYERYADHSKSIGDEVLDIAFKVSVEDFIFRPDSLIIEQGATIQFSYHGSVSVQKLSCEGEFDSVALGGDGASMYVHQFHTPGTFSLINEVFSFMACSITVTKLVRPETNSGNRTRGDEDNDQNVQNIQNSSKHGEQSLNEFMESKLLWPSKRRGGGIGKDLKGGSIHSYLDSSDDEASDKAFDTGSVRLVINNQIAKNQKQKQSHVGTLKSDLSSTNPPSSFETSARYLRGLAAIPPMGQCDESERESVKSSATTPIAGSDPCSPGKGLPRLCGSFPLATTSNSGPATAAQHDTIGDNINNIGVGDKYLENTTINVAVEEVPVLASAATKRRKRRKQSASTAAVKSGGCGLSFSSADIPDNMLPEMEPKPVDVSVVISVDAASELQDLGECVQDDVEVASDSDNNMHIRTDLIEDTGKTEENLRISLSPKDVPLPQQSDKSINEEAVDVISESEFFEAVTAPCTEFSAEGSYQEPPQAAAKAKKTKSEKKKKKQSKVNNNDEIISSKTASVRGTPSNSDSCIVSSSPWYQPNSSYVGPKEDGANEKEPAPEFTFMTPRKQLIEKSESTPVRSSTPPSREQKLVTPPIDQGEAVIGTGGRGSSGNKLLSMLAAASNQKRSMNTTSPEMVVQNLAPAMDACIPSGTADAIECTAVAKILFDDSSFEAIEDFFMKRWEVIESLLDSSNNISTSSDSTVCAVHRYEANDDDPTAPITRHVNRRNSTPRERKMPAVPKYATNSVGVVVSESQLESGQKQNSRRPKQPRNRENGRARESKIVHHG